MRMIMVICFLALCATAWAAVPRGDYMREMTSRVVALEKYNKVLKKMLAAKDRRSDARDTLLAEWFDEYHPCRGDSRYHRNQVQWKKR